MNEVRRAADFTPVADDPAQHGLFFTYHFDADGLKCDDPEQAAWTWRSYMISDMRARQAIGAEPSLPAEIKEAFLSGGSAACQIDYDEGWLYGDLPDLRHDYSAEARGLGHFRFAFNDRMLIGARKQPLDSVEHIRKLIAARTRPFRSPAELIETVMGKSLDGMSAEISGLSDNLDGIEDRIVCDSWHNERQTLVAVRRKLVVIHRQMAALATLFRHLDQAHRRDLPEHLTEMVGRLSHLSSTQNHDSEQLQGRARLLQDELMAKLTAQSNKLLYILSVMTSVLLPMTIISGLFGMNVGGLPLIQSAAGFWVVTLLSIAVAGTTFYFVKRLGDGM